MPTIRTTANAGSCRQIRSLDEGPEYEVVKGGITMRTKLDIITNIQVVLWVMIIGLCGGIEFLHGWNILLNVLMMLLTGAIIFLLSTLKGVMKHEYKRKRAYAARKIPKVQ